MNHKPVEDVSTAIAGGNRGRASQKRPTRVPVLTVIAHPMPVRMGDCAYLNGLAEGRPVSLNRNGPDFAPPGRALGRPLTDPHISRKPLRLEATPHGGVRFLQQNSSTRVIVAGTLLTSDYIVESAEIEQGVPVILSDRVMLLLHFADPSREESQDNLGLVGHSDRMRKVRADIRRVADLNVPVLIRGETGTGKELVASALHRLGQRRRNAFISVNIAAIPRDLAAAELFGARKGAFTGAVADREGFFRAAHGGSLFLDEVGDMPSELQVALLRVLENGEVIPVGSQRPLKVDVRLIAATDADLESLIEEGRFREPLLHRLAGYSIWIPPLHKRPEDIGRLFRHFAEIELTALGEQAVLQNTDPYAEPWLPTALAEQLVGFNWPGNVRQLRNITRQLVIGSRGTGVLAMDEQMARLFHGKSEPSPKKAAVTPKRRRPSDITEEELIDALRANDWDIKPSADTLGIPRSSVYELVKRFDSIRTAGDLSAEEIREAHEQNQGDLTAMSRELEVSRHALKRRLRELDLD